MTAVDVSRDARAVVGVGLDSANRQLIVLWDISALRLAGRVSPSHLTSTEGRLAFSCICCQSSILHVVLLCC